MNNGYLLAAVPPKKIIDFVDKYRKKYAKYTGYHTPPHITVYPPFYITDIDEEQFKKLLGNNLLNSDPFLVCIDSFDYFTGRNNVLYFKPDDRSKTYLTNLLVKIVPTIKLHTKDIYHFYKVEANNYHPHMTIAEKIPSDVLPKIKQQLNGEKVNFTFEVDSIQLLVQPSDSKVWQVKDDIKF
jgi:2'-5' RNA ligase